MRALLVHVRLGGERHITDVPAGGPRDLLHRVPEGHQPRREPGATLATVAGRVGFANAFALSAAFKREHGISPSEYRRRETRAAT
nr:helix-turn-helix domain-containing protein [Streptomyces sp. NBC_01795]